MVAVAAAAAAVDQMASIEAAAADQAASVATAVAASEATAAARNSAATVWLALDSLAIRAAVASPHPSNQHRAHDFGDTSTHLHVCIFCCNPVRDIRAKRVKWRTGSPSISPFSREFAHSTRSPD